MSERDPIILVEPRDEVETRAADFLQRRRLLRWNSMDQAELDAWLAESTSHRVAFLRLEAGVARIERVAEQRPPKLDRAPSRPRYHFAIPLLAASIAAIAALGFVVAQYFHEPADRVYSTEVGGRALLNFADRTQIALNTDTVLRFAMTSEQRMVWLEKGEAWFRVSHDAARPFTVVVGNRRITDLGTEFVVRSDAGRLEVALLSGRAQLSAEGDRSRSATLTPGDDAVATAVSVSFTRKTPQELADKLAWRRGMIVFRHTKLAYAVEQFNRYNRTKLVIADPAVARMEVGGEFRTDSINEFLRAMQVVLRIRVGRDGNNILISAPDDSRKAAGAP